MNKNRLIDNLKQLYGLKYGKLVLDKLILMDFQTWPFVRWFWFSNDLEDNLSKKQSPNLYNLLLAFIYIAIIFEICLGLNLVYQGLAFELNGGIALGLAVILAYPLIVAHSMLLVKLIWVTLTKYLNPKKLSKDLLCRVLESQVQRLRASHDFTVVAVAGSVGKTSTKIAIAKVLESSGRVMYQKGNYNDRLTVPLVVFGQELPNLINIFAWIRIIISNNKKINGKYEYKYVVVELGTDGPGQIAKFAYLKPEISVVTAVAMEHMEYFTGLDSVAAEELSVFDYSKLVLVNIDDIDEKYIEGRTYIDYGLGTESDYRVVSNPNYSLTNSTLDFRLGNNGKMFEASVLAVGKQGGLAVLAGAAVASILGYSEADIKRGLSSIKPFAGRMQLLDGFEGSIIIDDTYNSSPKAVQAALEVLYANKASQRIAILGDMNELGNFSNQAHKTIGESCDPKKLDMVVTIGQQSKKYLAKAALANGCKVISFNSPYAAGKFVKENLKPKALILVKGSQNGVFAEEAVKTLLASPKDYYKLVRQSRAWMSTKRSQFSDVFDI